MRARVLIADADPLLLAAYEAFLIAEGFAVTTARTGLGCLAELRRQPPNLLVIDPELPWGSGLGVLALMRDDPTVPRVPVLILSNHSPALLAEVRPPLRGYALLLKPVAPSVVGRLARTMSDWTRDWGEMGSVAARSVGGAPAAAAG